ncbi:MAG: DDE-type integrase/transposase/recombinase, partial [Pseudomonadota bacterium]
LSQIQNGSERVISYASHAFSKHEREYCVTRKELLAVYKYARHFKHYLIGKKFIIRTDHRALIWMLNWKKPNTSQYCSWKAELELFDFEIQHRKGKEHTNADAMSRFPHCNQCEVGHENPKKKTNVKIIANVEEIEKDAVKIIVEMLKTNDGNRIPRQWIRKMDKEMSQILKFKDNLYILEGKKLMLKRENCELEIPVRKKRNHIIDEAHKSLGHPGMFRMIGVIKEKYYWPSMETDIIFYTNRCNLCQIYKSQSSPKRTRSKLIARFPFDKIAIDITGPVRMSKSRNQYILGIIDHYSKYVALVPLKTTDTKTIIEALFSKWISVFGYPRSIHSDRGTNLNSSQMLQLCKELGIRKTSTTPYYPQGDGIIERLFRTVKPMLSIVTEENGIEWDKALPVVEFGIRNTRSRQTGYTPNEILFGRNLYHTATNESKDCAYQNHSNYVEILLRKQKIIENYVNEKNGRLCEEEQADVFKKGDWVWVKRIV